MSCASVSIALHEEDNIETRVNDANPESVFIVLELGGVSIYLPEYNTLCIERTRKIARMLNGAADEAEAILEQQRANKVPDDALVGPDLVIPDEFNQDGTL